jgi:hypothetical protein
VHRRYRLGNGGVAMFFHREIPPLATYTIHTRVGGWGPKWIVLVHVRGPRRDTVGCTGARDVGSHAAVQVFTCRGQRMALGTSKMVVKQHSGQTVPPEEFFASVGWDVARLRAACAEWDTVVAQLLAFEATIARAADALVPLPTADPPAVPARL